MRRADDGRDGDAPYRCDGDDDDDDDADDGGDGGAVVDAASVYVDRAHAVRLEEVK